MKKLLKNGFMDTGQAKKRIESIILQLVELRDSIASDDSSEHSPISQEVEEKLENRICLFCGKKIPAKETPSRGCHSKCYQKIRRAVKEGKTTDEMAVWKGQWAPKQQGGRKSESPFDSHDYLVSDGISDVIESLEIDSRPKTGHREQP